MRNELQVVCVTAAFTRLLVYFGDAMLSSAFYCLVCLPSDPCVAHALAVLLLFVFRPTSSCFDQQCACLTVSAAAVTLTRRRLALPKRLEHSLLDSLSQAPASLR